MKEAYLSVVSSPSTFFPLTWITGIVNVVFSVLKEE